MKIVLQRVANAKVTSEGKLLGQIGKGYLLLLGVMDEDTEAIADKMADKVVKLRIFEDQQGKTNLSLADVEGEVLVVSQFTLYADCRKGNRPSFTGAGSPDHANSLYEHFISYMKKQVPVVEHGEFGAEMKIELVNDGPFTILLDSSEVLSRNRLK